MKNIKKYFALVAIIFASISSNANININEIAQKMSESNEVIQCLQNQLKLSFGNMVLAETTQQQLPTEILNKKQALIDDNKALGEIINLKFPEFAKANESEKKEILTKVVEISSSFADGWKCIRNKTALFAAEVGITALGAFGFGVFYSCTTAMAIVDVIAVIYSGGAATPAAVTAAAPQVAACGAIAGLASAIATSAIIEYYNKLYDCF